MTALVALAVSIGLLGGIATALYLKVGLAIWAGFIAWACFFHTGGDTEALKKTIIGNLFGIFCAAIAAWLILSTNMGAAGPAVIVGVTVFLMVLAAHLKPFATIPASVYGYAATFAYLLQTADTMTKEKLMSASMANALLVVIISMALGALFGLASGKLGGALAAKA